MRSIREKIINDDRLLPIMLVVYVVYISGVLIYNIVI